jgi:hypothetical protein
MGLPANHINLSKFNSRSDPGFITFTREIKCIISKCEPPSSPVIPPTPVRATGTPPISIKDTFAQAKPYGQAEEIQRQIVEIMRLTVAHSDSRFLLERKRLADVYFARGLWKNAIDWLEDILQTMRADLAKYQESLLKAVSASLAMVLLEYNRIKEVDALLQGLPQATDSIEPSIEDVKAALLFRQGHYERSLQLRLVVCKSAEENHGKESAKALVANTFKTLAALAATQNTNIVPFYEEQCVTLQSLTENFPEEHPIVLRQKSILAFLLIKRLPNDISSTDVLEPHRLIVEKAVKLGNTAAIGLRGAIGPDHIYSMHASHNHAISLALAGQLFDARSISKSITRDLKANQINEGHPVFQRSRRLKSLLEDQDTLKDVLEQQDPRELLIDWAESAQWLPDLIFSGETFDSPDSDQTLTVGRIVKESFGTFLPDPLLPANRASLISHITDK